jgi:circadian clock protein KaiC
MAGKTLVIERCETGIPGFDKLCSGGLVRNSVNAVLGGPGAGKTTFLLQFLYNGATMYNENGIYLSFEPDVMDLYQDALALGMDFMKLEKDGKCKFIKMSPRSDVREIKDELMKVISKNEIKRICIDPISIFSISSNKETDLRETVFDLTSLLKRLKVTVLLADETIEGTLEAGSLGEGGFDARPIKFLSDGLINLYTSGLGGGSDRAVRISKMRRTAHVRGPISFQLTNSGFKITSSK